MLLKASLASSSKMGFGFQVPPGDWNILALLVSCMGVTGGSGDRPGCSVEGAGPSTSLTGLATGCIDGWASATLLPRVLGRLALPASGQGLAAGHGLMRFKHLGSQALRFSPKPKP